MIKVLYFASLRDAVGVASDSIDADGIATVKDVIALLYQRGGNWSTAFAEDALLLMSVNQEMANADDPVKAGDEVGFFPPVTGG